MNEKLTMNMAIVYGGGSQTGVHEHLHFSGTVVIICNSDFNVHVTSDERKSVSLSNAAFKRLNPLP